MIRLLLAALALLGLAHSGQASENALLKQVQAQSRYYGVGWQSNGTHWSIELMITESGAEIAYPSLGCTGVWAPLASSLGYLDYRETITSGTDVCESTGTVRLGPLSHGRLIYSWTLPGEGVMAEAILFPLTETRRNYMELLVETLTTIDPWFVDMKFLK